MQENLKIYFVCDAGMGSSALGAGLLQKRLKKAGCHDKVKNCSIAAVPDDVFLFHISILNTKSNKHFQTLCTMVWKVLWIRKLTKGS